MMDDLNNLAGLRGVSTGETAICTVGKQGAGLSYYGYDITDLAQQATFEEVAYLLTHGELPTSAQLQAYLADLKHSRELPQTLKEVLEKIPAHVHPMDVMRTGCSMLGTLEPELDFDQQLSIANRLLSVLPSIMCYWYCFSKTGTRINTTTDDDSIASHILHMLQGQPPDALQQRAMDVSLILYAEHEFNASTFTARVCASTLSDFYSAVCGAIGSLR
ncbi:MAG: citrate/2-methylcitrate synthase, partial [Methylococcales bacterium]